LPNQRADIDFYIQIWQNHVTQTLPSRTECQEALALLDAYMDALRAFHTTRNSFLSNLSADHAADAAGCKTGEQAFIALARTRELYWKHVQIHDCRRPVA
jgi:hypothetical protein